MRRTPIVGGRSGLTMPISDRDRELIQACLEGRISANDLTELEKSLVADAEVADAYAEGARLHAALERHFRKEYKIAQVANLLDEEDSLKSETAATAAA